MTHEWAPLREVIVGRPRYRILKPLPERAGAGLAANEWEQLKSAEGRLVSEAFPRQHARMVQAMDRAAETLRAHGVIVHEVPAFEASEEFAVPSRGRGHGSMQCFPRDLLLPVGDRVLELTVRDPLRRRELLPLRRLLRNLPHLPATRSMDGAGTQRAGRAFLEGGDCLINGREIYVGVSGKASNASGIRWLRSVMGDAWTVTAVPLASAFPHLDMALGLVRAGLGVRCPDAFPRGLPASLAGWHWVDITVAQALGETAANLVPIDARTTLVSEEASGVAEALGRQGQTVVSVAFGGVSWLQGGLRCWTVPVRAGGGDP